MVLFIANYPDREGGKDGMMQRVLAVDRQFIHMDRLYLSIRFFGNLRQRKEKPSDRLTVLKVNFFLHLPRIMRLAFEARRIYVHSIHNGFRSLPLYLFRNVVTDLHGVFPEELRYYGKRAGALLYGLVEWMAVRRSRALVAVSDVMAEHLRAKYRAFAARIYTIPIFDDTPIVRVERRDSGPLAVIYSGGSQKWQNVDKMMDAMAMTRQAHDYVILTPDIRFFEEHAAACGLSGKVRVLSVPKSEVYGHYHGADLGFVLRDGSIVNRAACPTKLVEYLACGVIPIVLQAEIGDFARRGYACIDLRRFVDGDLPSRAELAAMRAWNYRVLQEMRDAADGAMARLVGDITAGGGGHGA